MPSLFATFSPCIFCARRFAAASPGPTRPCAPSSECLERKRETTDRSQCRSSIFARHGSDNARDDELARKRCESSSRPTREFGRSYIMPCSGCQQATRIGALMNEGLSGLSVLRKKIYMVSLFAAAAFCAGIYASVIRQKASNLTSWWGIE